MRQEKSAARRRARQRLARATEAETRRRSIDQWSAVLVAVVIVIALVYVMFLAPALPQLVWTPTVIALCLVVGAAVGRALIGYRAEESASAAPELPALTVYGSLAAAALIPFLLSLKVGFLSDDFGLTEAASRAHSTVQAFTFLPFAALYRPLHVVVWWIGLHLWGAAPVGYHVLSLLLHLANSLLVLALGRRIIGNLHGAWAAALLFAVHPLHVEAITWASCQVDLQCTTFALLSLLALEGCLGAPSRARGALALGGSLLAFFLAALTKESALSLPGVAVFRVFLYGGQRRLRRAALAALPYAAFLALYLVMRFSALRGIGGYLARPTFWNTVFPSAPLRQVVSFFLPLNQPLARAAGGFWLEMTPIMLMAAGLVWWIAGLPRVRGSQLWLCFGYVVILAIPVWLLPSTKTDLEYSRYAYLPTIGLCLLFGELAVARWAGQARSRAPVVATIGICAALSAWYVMPWLGAARSLHRVTTAAARAVEALPASVATPVLYVENLPDTHYGAQVLRNGFPVALAPLLKRPVVIRQVGERGGYLVPRAVLALSTLYPGEHVVVWEPKAGRFKLVRSGGTQGTNPQESVL
jgi:hypothetical protein